MKIGIVGYGFVGKAVAHGFQKAELIIVDPILGKTPSELVEQKPEVVFICVPTPMGENGAINVSIVEKVLDEMSSLDNTLFVLKSTVTPDNVDALFKKYKNFVYNPEFLTEKNALNDFEFPFMHVFGGEPNNCKKLHSVYKKWSICAPCTAKFMSAQEASFVKYSINSYLATRVSFWNQMEQLVQSKGASYENVRDAFICDPRIGMSHTNVPGHDGRRGFGGSCFVKDSNALLHYSQNKLSVLKEAWNYNCDVRNQYGDILQREKDQHVSFVKIE